MRDGSCNVSTRFVLGGEAIFTLANGLGEHMTFKVYRAQPSTQFPQPSYFAKVLTGPDNTNDYTYVGRVIINTDNPLVTDPVLKRTAKTHFADDSKTMRAIKFALKAVWQIERGTYQLPPGYTIQHVGRCGKCGHPLTTPESLATGFGPDCAAALGIEWGSGDRNRVANTGSPRFAMFDFAHQGEQ